MRPGRFVLEVLIALYRFRLHVLLVGVLIAAAYFWVDIDPAREYGFGGGVLHGFFGFQNLILSWFTDHAYWAPLNSGRGYTTGYYVGLFVLPFLVRTTIEVILYVVKG